MIKTIDGKPAERIRHGKFVTMVPLVLISSGDHTLLLTKKKYNNNADSSSIELKVSIKKKERYKLYDENGKPAIKLRKGK